MGKEISPLRPTSPDIPSQVGRTKAGRPSGFRQLGCPALGPTNHVPSEGSNIRVGSDVGSDVHCSIGSVLTSNF